MHSLLPARMSQRGRMQGTSTGASMPLLNHLKLDNTNCLSFSRSLSVLAQSASRTLSAAPTLTSVRQTAASTESASTELRHTLVNASWDGRETCEF